MKTLMTATAFATALIATPLMAQGLNVEEYLAMSNDSAAERIVNETSMGDVTAAEVRIALSAMSAAEREVFFGSDDATRMAQIKAMKELQPMNSPAEAAAATN